MGTITDISPMLRLLFSRAGLPYVGAASMFSFNDPLGMCPECNGIGRKLGVDMQKALDKSKSLREGAINEPVAQPIVKSLAERLQHLVDIGLDYLIFKIPNVAPAKAAITISEEVEMFRIFVSWSNSCFIPSVISCLIIYPNESFSSNNN